MKKNPQTALKQRIEPSAVSEQVFSHQKVANMEKDIERIATTTALSSFTSSESQAQHEIVWKGGGEWGPQAPYAKMYDLQTIVTTAGEILFVERITPMIVMSYGVHILLQTDTDTISVHLGPGWFIENQDVKMAPRDKVEIKGSRIIFEGKPAIIAAEVKKGDDVLMLRDASGYPVWSGWRRNEHHDTKICDLD